MGNPCCNKFCSSQVPAELNQFQYLPIDYLKFLLCIFIEPGLTRFNLVSVLLLYALTYCTDTDHP